MIRQFAPRFRLRRVVLTAAAALLVLAAPVSGKKDDPRYQPRPISDAERAGIEAVLAFLESGPNAVLTRLAAGSPLRRLESGRALDEIAVRFGPAAGSEWFLRTPGRGFEDRDDVALFTVEFASGVADVLLLELAQDGGEWRIESIRCGVDPRTPGLSVEDELNDMVRRVEESALAPPTPRPSQRPSRRPFQSPTSWPPWLAVSALLAGCGLAAVWTRRTRSARGPAIALVAAALLITGCDLLPRGEAEAPQADTAANLEAPQLADLLPLRRLLTGGRSSGASEGEVHQDEVGALVEQLTGTLADDDPNRLAARAWQAQALYLDGALAAAREILEAIPEPDSLPLAAQLRAEMAALRDEDDAVLLYESMRRLGPDHDGLALDAAMVGFFQGEDVRAEEHVRSLLFMNSRDSEAYYLAAKLAAIEDELDKAEQLLAVGWALEPLSRATLFADPLMSILAIRSAVFPLFEFGRIEEPTIGPGESARRPLAIPGSASAKILGEHLEIEIADRSLHAPGGGDLMPESTQAESAARREARLVEHAVARLDELKQELRDSGRLRPSRRRSITVAAASLTQQERWDEVIDLTNALSSDLSRTPAELIRYRALALLRSERVSEGTNLLIELARSDLTNQRRDPTTFYLLGEMLAGLGQYDLAVRCMERASRMTKLGFAEPRRRQLAMIQKLENAKSVYETPRFRMVYPKSSGEKYPRQLSWVLDEEWKRIQKWIPVPANAPKVEIHLYPFREFLMAYSGDGGLVGGIYDGVVRIPLADLQTMSPEIIRLVSHELAHAMIDVATDDRAPNWFHEGLAGHVEMNQREINPMPDLHEAGRELSLGLLEDVFNGRSEPQLVSLAYTNAAWTLHYMEAQKGRKGIHNMLSAYRRGDDTEGAVRRVFGRSFADFDRDVRDWAIRDAPQIWPSETVAYHELFDELVERDAMNPLAGSRSDERLLSSRSTRAQQRAEEVRTKMSTWHRDYTAAVRPVKLALAQTLPLVQGQKQGDVKAACENLRQQLDRLLADRSHLSAPDRQVSRELNDAYRSFRAMTQHCLAARWANVRVETNRAVDHLGKAKKAMEPYGAAP